MQTVPYTDMLAILRGQITQRKILFLRLQEEKNTNTALRSDLKAEQEDKSRLRVKFNNALDLIYLCATGQKPPEHLAGVVSSGEFPCVAEVRHLRENHDIAALVINGLNVKVQELTEEIKRLKTNARRKAQKK